MTYKTTNWKQARKRERLNAYALVDQFGGKIERIPGGFRVTARKCDVMVVDLADIQRTDFL